MCSMIPATTVVCPVADGVHVHLDGVLEELVDQDRVARGDLEGPDHEAPQAFRVVDDLHRAARPGRRRGGPGRDSRSARPPGSASSVSIAVSLSGWRRFRRSTISWKRFRSSARSIASGEVPRIGAPAASRPAGEVQRGLAAELDDDAHAAFPPSRMWRTSSRVTGSKKSLSEVS